MLTLTMFSKKPVLFTIAPTAGHSIFVILFCSTRQNLFLFLKHKTASSSTTWFTWCHMTIIRTVTKCYWTWHHLLMFTTRCILEAATKWTCWGSSSSQPLWVRHVIDTNSPSTKVSMREADWKTNTCMLSGLLLGKMGERGAPLVNVCQCINECVMKIINAAVW